MSVSDPKEYFDTLQIRCPKLGNLITFAYCRKEASGLPCSRALICWTPRFPAELFFSKLLSPDEYKRCFENPPKAKIASLLELIEETRRRSLHCEKDPQ